jgi:hypothetical protein
LDRRSLFEKSDGKTFNMLRSCRGEQFDKSKFEASKLPNLVEKNLKKYLKPSLQIRTDVL